MRVSQLRAIPLVCGICLSAVLAACTQPVAPSVQDGAGASLNGMISVGGGRSSEGGGDSTHVGTSVQPGAVDGAGSGF